VYTGTYIYIYMIMSCLGGLERDDQFRVVCVGGVYIYYTCILIIYIYIS